MLPRRDEVLSTGVEEEAVDAGVVAGFAAGAGTGPACCVTKAVS